MLKEDYYLNGDEVSQAIINSGMVICSRRDAGE